MIFHCYIAHPLCKITETNSISQDEITLCRDLCSYRSYCLATPECPSTSSVMIPTPVPIRSSHFEETQAKSTLYTNHKSSCINPVPPVKSLRFKTSPESSIVLCAWRQRIVHRQTMANKKTSTASRTVMHLPVFISLHVTRWDGVLSYNIFMPCSNPLKVFVFVPPPHVWDMAAWEG